MPAHRLLFVSMHTSPADLPGAGDAGGMNVVERREAEALARLGHTVEMVTRRSRPDLPDVVTLAPGVTLRHLSAGPQRPLPKSVIDTHLGEFAAGLATLSPPDLVHSHHWMSGVAALPAARAWGVPHVQSYHSVAALPGSPLGEGEPPESEARVPGEAFTARESDRVVAISTAEARTVIQRCGADPARVAVIPPGVEASVFRPPIPEEAPPAGSWSEHPLGYVLFAARLQPLKGVDLAIRAVGGLPQGIRPHLVIAGDVSADFAQYRAHLDTLVGDLGMGPWVSFVGPRPREELALWMRHSRVVLVPSHSETFGLVALEAAASGTPVVASSTGGLREVIVDTETGLLVRDREPRSWTGALREIITDPVLAERMGVVARVHALRFDWRDTARRLERLYGRLIAQSR